MPSLPSIAWRKSLLTRKDGKIGRVHRNRGRSTCKQRTNPLHFRPVNHFLGPLCPTGASHLHQSPVGSEVCPCWWRKVVFQGTMPSTSMLVSQRVDSLHWQTSSPNQSDGKSLVGFRSVQTTKETHRHKKKTNQNNDISQPINANNTSWRKRSGPPQTPGSTKYGIVLPQSSPPPPTDGKHRPTAPETVTCTSLQGAE